jgi:RNA polymerase sigma-70 factor (ECF subfamily)
LTESHDFTTTYARFFPPIQAKCRRLLGRSHAAEDVAQETFLRLWRSGLGEEEGARTVVAWLYRTCTRLAIDALRDRRRSDVGAGDDVGDELACAADLGACLAARDAIVALAARVPEEELAVAILCRVDDLPQGEAAAVLGVSERTVRRMLDRFDARTLSLRAEVSP